MTAELAILNKTAVALAADSAVTITGIGTTKVYKTVNKLFTLSKYHPVGIMLYGNVEFMGLPMETAIKLYRDSLGKDEKDYIRDYADGFVRFLCDPKFCTDTQQEHNVRQIIISIFEEVQHDFFSELLKGSMQKRQHEQRDINRALNNAVNTKIKELIELDDLIPFSDNINKNRVLAEYEKQFTKAKNSIFSNFKLSKNLDRKLRRVARLCIIKDYFSRRSTGVVIAGYGKTEIFPSLIEMEIDGMIGGQMKITEKKFVDISREGTGTSIRPFAQKEMVHRFMAGVDFEYQSYIEISLEEALKEFGKDIVNDLHKGNKKAKTNYLDNLDQIIQAYLDKFQNSAERQRWKRFIEPILDIVTLLPKDELANMAEALVNLTSLKRRFSTEEETVGGPIDVAIISKGDGFVWIRRKHYFDPALNPQFFQKYFEQD